MRAARAAAARELPVAYAACELALLPSIPTPRFREPWGLVCNEAMHQAQAGDRHERGRCGRRRARARRRNRARGRAGRSARASRRRSTTCSPTRRCASGWATAARPAVAGYTYDAMVAAFDRALARRAAR